MESVRALSDAAVSRTSELEGKEAARHGPGTIDSEGVGEMLYVARRQDSDPKRRPSGRRPACWYTWRAELIPASPHPFPSSDRPLRPVKGPVAATESLRP